MDKEHDPKCCVWDLFQEFEYTGIGLDWARDARNHCSNLSFGEPQKLQIWSKS